MSGLTEILKTPLSVVVVEPPERPMLSIKTTVLVIKQCVESACIGYKKKPATQ